MTVQGFTPLDFQTFEIEGLEPRMEAIKERIRPKFAEMGSILTAELSIKVGHEMFLHIAKHARRTTNPPKDTWLAIAHDKRGYKKHPHFQLGLFDDHLFIWLAFIYELPNKEQMASKLLHNVDKLTAIVPNDFMISYDHMQKKAIAVEEMNKEDWISGLERFRDVKKAEFLVGRHIAATDPLLQNGDALLELAKETYEQVLPIYRLAQS